MFSKNGVNWAGHLHESDGVEGRLPGKSNVIIGNKRARLSGLNAVTKQKVNPIFPCWHSFLFHLRCSCKYTLTITNMISQDRLFTAIQWRSRDIKKIIAGIRNFARLAKREWDQKFSMVLQKRSEFPQR
jgi:hypothetical protein